MIRYGMSITYIHHKVKADRTLRSLQLTYNTMSLESTFSDLKHILINFLEIQRTAFHGSYT